MKKTTGPLQIPRRSSLCATGGDPFETGAKYYSLVRENEEGAMEREDFCESCWTGVDKVGGVFWQGKVPQKKERAKYADLSRDDRAFAILRDTLGEERESAPAEAFVLGLYLARQRKLLARKVVKGQRLYEVAGTEEIIAIPELPLSSLEVESLQTELAAKLRAE